MLEEVIKKAKLIELQVQDINNDIYELIDKDNNKYKFKIYFNNINCTDIKYINMSIELLDPNYYEYSDTYTFGPIGKKYGRVLTNKTIQDLIMIDTDNNKIYLQRYYG